MEPSRTAQPWLARQQARRLLEMGLLDSAETWALLELQSPLPSAEGLALIGEVCVAKRETRRALHFLQHAQSVSELRWDDASSPGDSTAAACQLDAAYLLGLVADCHEQLGQEREALAALCRIPEAARSPRQWGQLGRLHRRAGMHSPACAAFKRCLALCPLAVEAALALAELSEPLSEIEKQLEDMEHPLLLALVLQPQQPQGQQQHHHPLQQAQPAAGTPAQEEQQQEVEADGAAAMAVDSQQQQQQQAPSPPSKPAGGRQRRAAHKMQPKRLLRGESAREHELVPAAADRATSPLCGSPVAVLPAFSPGSGQPTPAVSPAEQRQLDGTGACAHNRGDGLRQQQQQQQQQQPATRRVLHLGGQGAAEVAAPPAQPEQQQQQQHVQPWPTQQQPQAQPQQEAAAQQQAGPSLEAALAAVQPLLPAARLNLQLVQRLVRLAAALASEDRGALRLGQQLLDAAPKHPLALHLAAECQASHGAAASALALFSRAREQDPFSLRGAPRHAELLCQAGDSLALCQLANACMEAGQTAQQLSEPWLVAAAAKELAGELYAAIIYARTAVEHDEASPEAHLCLGRLLGQQGGSVGLAAGTSWRQEALAALRLQRSYRAYSAAVDASLEAGMLQEALRLAREARAAFPACQASNVLLGRVLSQMPARQGEAEALLTGVLRGDPRCEEAALCLANLLESVSRQADAVALLERQVAVAPSEALHEAAGRLQLELDQLELAVMHFNAALGFNPNSAAAAQGLLEVEAIQGPGAEELTDDSDYEGMPEDFRGPQDLPFGFN